MSIIADKVQFFMEEGKRVSIISYWPLDPNQRSIHVGKILNFDGEFMTMEDRKNMEIIIKIADIISIKEIVEDHG